MSFTAITTGEIASGEPTTNSLWTKVKDDLDDHETRIETLEGASSVYPPIIFRVNGYYYVMTDALKTTTNFSFTISGVRILIDQAGSSGSTQIDILKSTGGGAFTSIFTVKPSISYTAGNDALSSTGTLDPTQVNVVAGDILRMDITSSQVGGNGFLARMDFTR